MTYLLVFQITLSKSFLYSWQKHLENELTQKSLNETQNSHLNADIRFIFRQGTSQNMKLSFV